MEAKISRAWSAINIVYKHNHKCCNWVRVKPPALASEINEEVGATSVQGHEALSPTNRVKWGYYGS